jgi:hypothetical protein
MAAVEVRFEELVKREGKDIDILRALVKENSAVQREMKVRTIIIIITVFADQQDRRHNAQFHSDLLLLEPICWYIAVLCVIEIGSLQKVVGSIHNDFEIRQER